MTADCHLPSVALASVVPLNPQPSTLNPLRGLRLCFLAGTLGQGGAERQLYYILKCLKKCGADVSLLTLTQGEHWETPIRELGVPIHFVGGSGSRLVRLARVWQTVRRLRPRVVQSQHFYTNTYVALAARIAGCRHVGAIRNDGFSEVSSNGPFFGRLNLRLPRLLAANSRAALRNLGQMGVREGRLFYLPNVIDTAHFVPCTRIRSGSGDFTILGLGRLAPQKRFDRFLRVVSELRKKRGAGVGGCIVGGGPLRAELEMTARDLALLPDGVTFSAAVPDARKCFAKGDVLLLTSDHEGTPNVVMEAMACGVPVVASNVGGVADLIKHGESGFLFEPEDLSGAVASLDRLVREPALAQEIGSRARTFIEQRHSTALLPEMLAQLYAQVLAA